MKVYSQGYSASGHRYEPTIWENEVITEGQILYEIRQPNGEITFIYKKDAFNTPEEAWLNIIATFNKSKLYYSKEIEGIDKALELVDKELVSLAQC